jgi:hypothetical protein
MRGLTTIDSTKKHWQKFVRVESGDVRLRMTRRGGFK